MADKPYKSSFDIEENLATDYVLILTGVGSALIALAYLLLT